MRQRCYQCFRPMPLCFCEAIPRIDNRTEVLILQHIGERFHAFNTARIVRKALRRCNLVTDHNQRLGTHRLPIHANAGLLYPRANAPALTELSASERPSQLVIIDGTWHQAKTIDRDVTQLADLPCYRLSPATPGEYRIRREPNAQSLSTLEATVAALQVLEPDTIGLHQLLSAFHKMVESQMSHPANRTLWRRIEKRKTGARHIPPALLASPHNLIVAYGEAMPGQRDKHQCVRLPVNWVAHRLGTADRFTCQIRQRHPLTATALQHMRLSAESFDNAITADEFRRRWAQFLQPKDLLVVYHRRTYLLLQQINALQPPCLVLKSIFGKWRTGFRSVEELLAIEGVPLPNCVDESRAAERLEMAVALVEHLRLRHICERA